MSRAGRPGRALGLGAAAALVGACTVGAKARECRALEGTITDTALAARLAALPEGGTTRPSELEQAATRHGELARAVAALSFTDPILSELASRYHSLSDRVARAAAGVARAANQRHAGELTRQRRTLAELAREEAVLVVELQAYCGRP